MTFLPKSNVMEYGWAIENARGIILKAMPQGPDMHIEYDYAQWAPLYALAHWGIEIGLKALLVQANDEPPNWHDLGELFQRLRDKDPERAKKLEDAFIDIVNFYTIDRNRFKHFGSLDDYFREYGNRGLYNDFRYWVRGKTVLYHVPFFVHRELLTLLENLCKWGKAPVTSQLVKRRVHQCLKREVENHVNQCDICIKSYPEHSSLRRLTDLFLSDPTISDRLSDAYNRKFQNGNDTCADKVMHSAFQHLSKSDDLAVRYYTNRLTDLPKGSLPHPTDVKMEMKWLTDDTSGIVSFRNGDELGSITRMVDDRWYVQSYSREHNMRYAKTKVDAVYWLVHMGTVMVEVSIDRGPHTRMRTMSPPSPLYGGWDDSRPGHKITFVDDAHGLQVGQRIDVRSDRFPSVLHDGIITKVSGREVIWGDT